MNEQTHTHTHSSTPAASQPLCMKASGTQKVGPERQTAGSLQTAENVTLRRSHGASSPHACQTNSNALKRHEKKKNKQQRCAYPDVLRPPSDTCRPGLKPAAPTRRRHVLIREFQTDAGLMIHTHSVTHSYCSTPSFDRRQTPILSV